MNGGISFSHVTKRYGERLVLDDVSFEVPLGQVVGLVGPNGAGKTSALRALLGLSQVDSGTISIGAAQGKPLRPGYVGASLGPAAHPGRTGRAHLRITAAAIGARDDAIDVALRAVGLDTAGGVRVKHYSLGMSQRLALAGALLGQPELLVLDEPANGLDPDGIEWLHRHIRSVADGGGGALISSHLLVELAQMADAVVMLDRRVLWSGSVLEAEHAGGLQHVYRTVRQSEVEAR